jgi:hypothetical protein
VLNYLSTGTTLPLLLLLLLILLPLLLLLLLLLLVLLLILLLSILNVRLCHKRQALPDFQQALIQMWPMSKRHFTKDYT